MSKKGQIGRNPITRGGFYNLKALHPGKGGRPTLDEKKKFGSVGRGALGLKEARDGGKKRNERKLHVVGANEVTRGKR